MNLDCELVVTDWLRASGQLRLEQITGTASIYTDNTSIFFNGNLLQQDPYYAIDGSIDYSVQSGIWTSGGVGIGVGG